LPSHYLLGSDRTLSFSSSNKKTASDKYFFPEVREGGLTQAERVLLPSAVICFCATFRQQHIDIAVRFSAAKCRGLTSFGGNAQRPVLDQAQEPAAFGGSTLIQQE
jgi:hypothetical protein